MLRRLAATINCGGRFTRPTWLRLLLPVAIVALAIGLTLASLSYVRPADCRQLCTTDTCPPGHCRFREQRAGFLFPVLIDSGGGGSPLNGWGRLGPEDPPVPFTFVLDVGMYSLVLWLIWRAMRRCVARKGHRRAV